MNYFSRAGISLQSDADHINIVDIIFSEVCLKYQITIAQLKDVTRKRHIVEARQIICYLLGKHTKLSLVKIGHLIGGKDHATVVHGRKNIINLMEVDQEFKLLVKYIETKVVKTTRTSGGNHWMIEDFIKLQRWDQAKLLRLL